VGPLATQDAVDDGALILREDSKSERVLETVD
jgi:hypothetical protein